jgi:IS1 family transposase
MEYFQTHATSKIRVEMDEMWSFYHEKRHQIWLWWAIDHDTGEVVAYWFGSREHGNLDRLLELLLPLKLGTVYTDGNYAYYERIDSDVLVVSKKNTQKIYFATLINRPFYLCEPFVFFVLFVVKFNH